MNALRFEKKMIAEVYIFPLKRSIIKSTKEYSYKYSIKVSIYMVF